MYIRIEFANSWQPSYSGLIDKETGRVREKFPGSRPDYRVQLIAICPGWYFGKNLNIYTLVLALFGFEVCIRFSFKK